MAAISRALISVSDKSGVIDFAKGLVALGIEIVSTGGTAKSLSDAGLAILNVSDVTKFPEMLDGRVKTLHPAVHGGILADRAKREHMDTIEAHEIKPIDMVVVNLYPFVETVAKLEVTREEAIENIDIGGPSMIRSAAKNHASVAVVVSPHDYDALLLELQEKAGSLSQSTRDRLAAKAFLQTAAYDTAIAAYLSEGNAEVPGTFPPVMSLQLTKVQDLRYGENPHQPAAFYKENSFTTPGIAGAEKLHGKELSFNNIYDLNAAFAITQEFASDKLAAAAVIKHTNPCGIALASTLHDAFQKAREGDPVSAYGGILAVSRIIDEETANLITGKNTFFEAIIAPGFTDKAFKVLTEKKQWCSNLILLQSPMGADGLQDWDYKRVAGGMLVQVPDTANVAAADLTTVTQRTPTAHETENLLFAWKVVKHVKSNAIVIAKDLQIIGVGAGQMNRVQSVRLAVAQAGEKALGAVMASDAFFPFADGPEAAGQAGIVAIIQPGGSKKDNESITMSDKYNIAMVVTGKRHFRH